MPVPYRTFYYSQRLKYWQGRYSEQFVYYERAYTHTQQ